MARLLWLVLATGVAPLILGWWRLHHRAPAQAETPQYGATFASALLCALAFNLTFLWQEVWLVIPKAFVPGLHPILYHNDHDWTGHAAVAELLQGTGAIATLVSGLVFLALLGARIGSGTWGLVFAWLAFQGLFQSLSQVAIGSLLPGNDVGRAFAYLGFGGWLKSAILLATVLAMAVVGRALAQRWPARSDPGSRAFAQETILPAAISILLILPFRIPRNPIEVALIPTTVMMIGMGWLLLGASTVTVSPRQSWQPPRWPIPLAGLIALLLIFQLVLRPGIPF